MYNLFVFLPWKQKKEIIQGKRLKGYNTLSIERRNKMKEFLLGLVSGALFTVSIWTAVLAVDYIVDLFKRKNADKS